MLCRIADLLTVIPNAAGLLPRCREYLVESSDEPDIIISEEKFNFSRSNAVSRESVIYNESGFQFYYQLLLHDGLFLHSSAVMLDQRAYLFSGPSGVGKSTHTRLWLDIFGDRAKIINDDKPALRRLDGKWYAFGTPWSGKNRIDINIKASLGGICFLKQSDKNEIRRLDAREAIPRVISQTSCYLRDPKMIDLMLGHVEKLIEEVPIYELCNRPEPEAAQLSYKTMREGAEEAGL